MADNKLRLQIVTQLDAAGIKATKDQVDQLELGVRRAGNAGQDSGQKFGALEKAIGKLPGPLGDITRSCGGLVGTIGMVTGAMSVGIEIGNKIVDFQRKIGLLGDATKDLVAANKAYDRELSLVKSSLAEVTAAEMARMSAAASAADKSMKAIDAETAAYMRQASALNGLRSAQGNGEVMQLEREKFNFMQQLAGTPEAAEQLGRYYDVLIEEVKAKQQIAAFDSQSRDLDRDRLQAERAYEAAATRAAEAKQNQAAAENALSAHRQARSIAIGDEAGMYTNEADAAKDDELEKILKQATLDAQRAQEIADKRAEKLDQWEANDMTRQMERANLVASGSMSVDRAAAAYDSYVMQTGNPLGADIDQSWAADMLKHSQDADQAQRDILAVVKDFGDKFERLLEVK